MRAHAPASELLNCLTTAALATPRISDRPGNTGVLLEVVGGRFDATGTDGDLAITSSVTATSPQPGEILLPPRPLISYLTTLPADADVTVQRLSTDELEVGMAGRTPYRFRPISASFTRPSGARLETRPVDLDGLAGALRIIGHATSREHRGVQLVSGEQGLVLNATDNYRLASAQLPRAGFGAISAVVPLNVLELVARLELPSVAIDTKRTVIRFASPSTSVTAKLLAAPFPPTESLLAGRGNASIDLPVPELRAALRPLEAVAAERPLTVDITGDTITLSATNLEVGAGTEQVVCPRGSGAPSFRFGVSAVYLKDAIGALDTAGSSRATLWWTTPDAALYLTVTQPVDATLIVMPQTLD